MKHLPTSALSTLSSLAASLLLVACGGSSSDPADAGVDARTTLTFNACPVPIADDSALCGTLSVPEDRTRPTSRMIGLPFLILPANSAPTRPDPVVFYTGGPGPSALLGFADAPAELLAQLPLRQQRDLIVLNQRGTALTLPADLGCPELAIDYANGQRWDSVDDIVAAATACRDRLVAGGADLAAYDSRSSARDMEELRILLGRERGFTKWNVVGTSYGSRLALVSLRDAPQGIRSVVLDGPLPPQIQAFYDAGALDAVTEVVQACEQQAACAAAFPRLQSRFAAAVQALEEAPATIGSEQVSGHRVLAAVSAVGVEQAPLFMDRIARGDIAGADALLPFGTLVELSAPSDGMYHSVMCRDEGVAGAMEDTPLAQGAGWPDAVRHIAARYRTWPTRQLCPAWTAGQHLPAREDLVVRSDVPALITVGQFDPVTPVSNGRLLLTQLSRARMVVLPGRGHGLIDNQDACTLQIIAEYVDDPNRAPDVACAAASTAASFAVE